MTAIKVKGGLRRLTAHLVLATSLSIDSKIYSIFTPAVAPAPPVDQPTLEAANDRLAAAIGAAEGGSKQSRAERNAAKEVVVRLLDQLAMYVQSNCGNDVDIVILSGFTPISSARTAAPPVSESIRKLVHGKNSGDMDATLMPYPDAGSYEIRCGMPLPGGALPETWISKPIVKLRPATTISGLTPGATYVFQARAVTHGGYSDWGNPIFRIVL